MRMRVRCIVSVAALALLALPVTSCGSDANSTSMIAPNSEVIVRRVDNNNLVRLRIYIDGKSAGTLAVGRTSRFKIKNGVHTIFATAYDYSTRSTEVSQFTANGARYLFSITDTSIVFIGEEPMGSIVAPGDYRTSPLDSTIKLSFDQLARPLRRRARVAIINIASDNAAEGNYIIEELTSLSVRSPKKFVVIDRRKLEAIRVAKNFERTSDMEDDFLISIGHLLGAEVIITGYMNGEGNLRHLWVRALDVRTGAILSMSSSAL